MTGMTADQSASVTGQDIDYVGDKRLDDRMTGKRRER
jgi:hypothetical protein